MYATFNHKDIIKNKNLAPYKESFSNNKKKIIEGLTDAQKKEKEAKEKEAKERAYSPIIVQLAYLCRPIGSTSNNDWHLVGTDADKAKKEPTIFSRNPHEIQSIFVKEDGKKDTVNHSVVNNYAKLQFEENLELALIFCISLRKFDKYWVLSLDSNHGNKILNDTKTKITIDGETHKLDVIPDNMKETVKKLTKDSFYYDNGKNDKNTSKSIYDTVFDNNIYMYKYKTKERKKNLNLKTIKFTLTGQKLEVTLPSNNKIKLEDMKNKNIILSVFPKNKAGPAILANEIQWNYAFYKHNKNFYYNGFDIISMNTAAVILTIVATLIVIFSAIGIGLKKKR